MASHLSNTTRWQIAPDAQALPNSAPGPLPHGRGSFRARGRGFTLIEAALVTVIVGVGVLSIVAAQQAFHEQNDHAQRSGAGLMLANEVRELMMNLPFNDPTYRDAYFGPEPNENSYRDYNDVDDFAGSDGDGTTLSPPIAATREALDDMDQWTQQIDVEYVFPSDINVSSGTVPSATEAGDSGDYWYAVRITCRVLYQGPNDDRQREVTRMTWLRAGR